MRVSDLQRAGLIHSPSVRRWLTEGAVPCIEPVFGRVRDLSREEAAVLCAFDAVAMVAGLELAAYIARLVNQHVRAGILTPVIARRGFLSVSIDVLELVAKVGEAGR